MSEKNRGVKDDPKLFGLSQRMELPLPEMGKWINGHSLEK